VPRPVIVAVREYLALIRTRTFLLSLFLAPALPVLVLLLGSWGGDSAPVRGRETIAVVDHSGVVVDELVEAAERKGLVVETPSPGAWDEASLRRAGERLRERDLAALLVIGPGVVAPADERAEDPTIRLYTDELMGAPARWLPAKAREIVQLERLRAAGVEEEVAARLLSEVPVQMRSPPGGEPEAEAGWAVAVRALAPFVVLLVVFLVVMASATPLLQAVIEEKQQRIAEVLLGAVSPFQLMLGKLLGTAGVGVTILALYLAAAAAVAWYTGYGDLVSPFVIAVAMVATAVALVLYGALFLAMGAASNELKDAQGMMTLALMLLALPLLLIGRVTEDPQGPLTVALSLFPFSAPMLLPLRLELGAVPPWQIALSLGLALVTTVAVVWAAGRVFRVGMLAHGRTPGIRQLLGWIVRG